MAIKITDHARERYAERFPDCGTIEWQLGQARPWGAQFGYDSFLLSPDGVVFAMTNGRDGPVIKTVLTKEQATANMEMVGLGRDGSTMRRAERAAVKAAKAKRKPPRPRLAGDPLPKSLSPPKVVPTLSEQERRRAGITARLREDEEVRRAGPIISSVRTMDDDELAAALQEYERKRLSGEMGKKAVGLILLAIGGEKGRRNKQRRGQTKQIDKLFEVAFRRIVKEQLGEQPYKELLRRARAAAEQELHKQRG